MTLSELKEWIAVHSEVTSTDNDHWAAGIELIGTPLLGHGSTIENAYKSLRDTIYYSHYREEMLEQIKNYKK